MLNIVLKLSRPLTLAGALALAAGAAQPAFASTTGSTLSVTATVADSCAITTSAVAFGSVNASADTDSTGSISVTCTNGTAYSAAADGGTSGSVSARTMASGANNLSYALYTDSARTTVWGDGTGSTGVVTGTGDGTTQSTTIYGRVPSGQNPKVGSYSDVVNVTVTY